MNLKLWLKGLGVFVLSALITSAAGMKISPSTLNFSSAGLKRVAMLAAIVAIKAVLLYLKRSPLQLPQSLGKSFGSISGVTRTLMVMALMFFLCTAMLGQAATPTPTPTPSPTPLADVNSGVHIDLSMSYSLFNQTPTINGSDSQSATVGTLRVPITNRFAGVIKMIMMPGQNAQITLAGGEYRRNAAEFLKSPALKFDPSKYDLFVYGAVGGKRQDSSTTAAFSYMAGGGLDYKLTSNLVVRAVDIAYLKTDLQSKGLVLTNHLQFAPGISLRF